MIEFRLPVAPGVTLKVTWQPERAAQVLDDIANNVHTRKREFLEAVGQLMRRSYAANFAQAGRPHWQELAASTVAGKQSMMRKGMFPPTTKSGRIPRRLMQVNLRTGVSGVDPFTILVVTGALRDSYAQKGARGNVTEIGEDAAFFGSQLTIQRTLRPDQPVKPYHILTKKAVRLRRQGHSVSALIPLALIHERGAPGAHIPARPVAVLQAEDMESIKKLEIQWLEGQPL